MGGVKVSALLSSLVSVVRRHEILTAKIQETPSEVTLYLDESFVPCIDVIDLRESDIGSDRIDGQAEEIINDRVWRPFEVDNVSGRSGPLMRAFLVIVSDDRTIVGIVVHHVIADFLSTAIIGRDLSRCYESNVRGKIPRRSTPAMNFIDHTIEFDTWLASPAGRVAVTRWRAKIEADSPRFMIPRDGIAQDPASILSLQFAVPAGLSKAMRSFAGARRITLFALCLAGYLLAIMQASGEMEGVIYIVHLGRDQPRLFNAVGFFAGIVGVHVSVRTAGDFEQLVSLVQRHCDDLFSTTPVPVDKLGLSNCKSGSLFNFVDCSVDINGSLFSIPIAAPCPPMQQSAGFGHGLICERTSEGLKGILTYLNYSELTMREFAIDMLALLASAIDAPDRRVDHILVRGKHPHSRRPFLNVFS
jgi:hypothetical protein